MIATVELDAVDETVAKMFAKYEADKLGPGDWTEGKLRIGDPVKISGVSVGEYAYIAELPDDYHKIDTDGLTIKRVKIIKTSDTTVTVEFPDSGTTEVIYDLVARSVATLIAQAESYVNDLEHADFSKHILERHKKLLAIRDTIEAEGDAQ